MMLLLTGERRVGKSTVCLRLVELAHRVGRRAGGFISVAQFDERGEKIGIELLDVSTGRRQLLATTLGELDGPSIGPYRMSASTLAWGVELVRVALHAKVDLLVVDEIGPIELVRHQGFAPVLSLVMTSPPSDGVIVVRPELLGTLAERLKPHLTEWWHVTPINRDSLPMHLAQRLWDFLNAASLPS